ncbi:MAG: hypothetical protein OXE87_10895 [Chloroflexi bacterium]|nr:hypothetical protein [Chloroflexota bacterium]
MDCTKCGLPIEGGSLCDDTITVSVGWNPFLWDEPGRKGQDVRHAECADDATRIPHYQFRKWAVARIRATQQAASVQVHNHNGLVDAPDELYRAPALPTNKSCSAVNDNAVEGTPIPDDGAKL